MTAQSNSPAAAPVSIAADATPARQNQADGARSAPNPAAKPAPKPGPKRPVAKAPTKPPRPPVGRAKPRRRHKVIALTFTIFVLLPIVVSAWYLWTRAADQYASYVGFSVRSEQAPSPSELLGGLVELSSSSSSDTEILYKFIQSHDVVSRIDKKLDLRAIWSKPENDPVFAYSGTNSTESLLKHWDRMVSVYFDKGMLDLRVKAFTPEDAHAIAQAIYEESSRKVNELSDVAREDAIKYAKQDLDTAVERLKLARQTITTFRNNYQIVDPTADVASQVGVMTSLQQQLAEALIQQGLLRQNALATDPRSEQANLRVKIIKEQIDEEKRKFGSETSNGELLSDIVGKYESLAVDRQFAETTYTAALAGYDIARADAQRQSRYLAAYVAPTLAQEAEYPERAKLLAILSSFILIVWLIGVLIFYSLRDRR